MSEKNIPPENQALQQAIETLQQTDTQENRAKMLEAVVKAKFISFLQRTSQSNTFRA